MDIELDLTVKDIDIDLVDKDDNKPHDNTNTTLVFNVDPENKSIKVGIKLDF